MLTQWGAEVPPHFRSGERKFQGTKVPGNMSSRKRKYQRAKVVPGSESTWYFVTSYSRYSIGMSYVYTEVTQIADKINSQAALSFFIHSPARNLWCITLRNWHDHRKQIFFRVSSTKLLTFWPISSKRNVFYCQTCPKMPPMPLMTNCDTAH